MAEDRYRGTYTSEVGRASFHCSLPAWKLFCSRHEPHRDHIDIIVLTVIRKRPMRAVLSIRVHTLHTSESGIFNCPQYLKDMSERNVMASLGPAAHITTYAEAGPQLCAHEASQTARTLSERERSNLPAAYPRQAENERTVSAETSRRVTIAVTDRFRADSVKRA